MDENIDEMVDEIFGDIDAGSRPPCEYRLGCVRCGDIFEARTPDAKYCPSCRQKVRREAGRKGAEKAHGMKEKAPDPAPVRKTADEEFVDMIHKAEYANLWTMPEAWRFWKRAFSKNVGFLEWVIYMRTIGVEIKGLERDDEQNKD